MVLVCDRPEDDEITTLSGYVEFPVVSLPDSSEINADLMDGLSTEDEAMEQLSRLQ